MRNILLGLVLANLLLLAWHRWIAPQEVDVPDLSTKVPTLVLMPGSQQISPERLDQGVNSAGSSRQCMKIGPFVDDEQANDVGFQLAAGGFTVSQTSQEGQAWVGHWVQIEDLGSREQATRLLRRLTNGGLADAYIVESDETRKISLGVFREQDRAARVAAEALQLGIEATISDRFRPATEYWLEVISNQGGVDLSEFQLVTSQILRSERIACW